MDSDWLCLGHVLYFGPITVFEVSGLLLAILSPMPTLSEGSGLVMELCSPDDGRAVCQRKSGVLSQGEGGKGFEAEETSYLLVMVRSSSSVDFVLRAQNH